MRARTEAHPHNTPKAREIAACSPWPEAELAAIRAEAAVGRGATAAKALVGRRFMLTTRHGQLVDSHLAPIVTATFHLSSIVRSPDSAGTRARYVAGLGAAREHQGAASSGRSGAGVRRRHRQEEAFAHGAARRRRANRKADSLTAGAPGEGIRQAHQSDRETPRSHGYPKAGHPTADRKNPVALLRKTTDDSRGWPWSFLSSR
jgi:hypothetical protein